MFDYLRIESLEVSELEKVMPLLLKSLSMAVITTMVLSVSPSMAQEAGDAAKGEKVFKKCTSCHQIGEGASNGVGPMLTGIIGRTAGTVEGFKYGKSILAAGEAGLVWSDDTIFEYLLDTKKFLRMTLDDKKAKSKMSFKLKKEKDRRAVIAYLKTFSPQVEQEDEGATTDETSTTN